MLKPRPFKSNNECKVQKDLLLGSGGGGGGKVVSMLAIYSDDMNSNPAKAYSFSVKLLFEKNENILKEAGI